MRARRGFILILTIFLLGLLQLLALFFGRTVIGNLHSAGRYREETQTQLAADAGLQRALAEVSHRLDNGQPLVDFSGGGNLTGDQDYSFTYEVDVDPGGIGAEFVEVRAEGHLRDDRTTRSSQILARRDSFASFARFMEVYPPIVWFTGGAQTVNGPVHSNDNLYVQAWPSFFPPTAEPILFQEGLRVVGQVFYQQADPRLSVPNPVDPVTGAITNPALYRQLYGPAGLREGVQRVPLPDPSTDLLARAQGTGPIRLGPGGAALPAGTVDGGVLIDGEVDVYELRLVSGTLQDSYTAASLFDNPGIGANPLHVIQMGGRTFQVVEVRHSDLVVEGSPVTVGNTVVREPGSGTPADVLAGLPNGAVFATGDIRSLAGINRDPHTIGVDPAGSGTIWLADSLVRNDVPPHSTLLATFGPEELKFPAVPGTADNPLGLVCRYLRLPPASRRGQALFVFASIFALGPSDGGLRCVSDADVNTLPHAYVHIVGSLAEHTRAVTASTVDPGFGWTVSVVHDKSMVDNPPPGYPATNELQIVGVTRE